MLEKILIENYRCYERHEIDFKPLSVIVGKNNAGKSTLIEALRLVSLALSKFRSSVFIEHPGWIDLPKFAKGISPSLRSIAFNTENLFHKYGSPPSIITASFTGGARVVIYLNDGGEIFCILKDHNDDYVTTRKGVLILELPSMNILPQITPVSKTEVVLKPDYVRKNLSSDLASLHFRNQLSIFYENFRRFSELAQQSWSGLRILEFQNQIRHEGEKLALLVQDSGFVAEIGWMGHGLQMWLQIMWFLARVREDETIILDEPDVYMHPELQRKLIRLLKNKFEQVVVSTHSIEIISEVEPENILIIDKEKDKSVFANNVPVVQRILNSIGSIHNFQLSKLWATQKLLIVEGEDISILKRLHNILFPESMEAFDSIPNFDIGGWGGWNFARGSSMLLKETVDDSVKIYCLFDSDFHVNEVKAERINEAQKLKVNIHIWNQKEIENYLVVPSVIRRILVESSSNASCITINEIENVIKMKVLEMQEDVVQNFANEIQKRDRKLSIPSALTLAKSYIDNLQYRVSGKSLVSALSSWTQEKFGVSLSPIKLAQNHHSHEIHREVKKVITAIVKGEVFEKEGGV